MADPIPVNTRQERNPQPVTTPFGNRPPFGNLPLRQNQGANAAPPRPQPHLGGDPLPANRQPPQATLFERRQPRGARRRAGQGNETVMHVIAAIILIAVVVLSYLAQSPPSQVTSFAPRSVGAAAQAQPTAVPPTAVPPTPVPYSPTRWDWGAPGAYTGIDAWVMERTLIRACPNNACVALANPTILEAGLLTDLVAIDPTRTWVQINASRPGNTLGSGWIPLAAVRPNGDLSRLPVIAA